LWRTVAGVADLLNNEIRAAHLEFNRVNNGKKSYELRWKECIDHVVTYLPAATSALYVRNYFKKDSRDSAWQIVEALKDEFENTLNRTEWMDDETKQAALEKAKNMKMHIGYPDELSDDMKITKYYEGLKIDENNFFESIVNISLFDAKKISREFRMPVNKTNWEDHAYVAVVNAFYNPIENSIRELIIKFILIKL
jgi:predicted metalloendopeptidase